jgi:hypothetical protein
MDDNDIHVPGAKDDMDKPRLDLVLGDFKKALWGVGLVGTFGAKKYSDRICVIDASGTKSKHTLAL